MVNVIHIVVDNIETKWVLEENNMTIGEIIKNKDTETYNKLIKMGGSKNEKKMDKAKCRRIYKES